MKKIYVIWDKVADEPINVIMGTNEMEAVRTLAFSGFFKAYRIEDVEIVNSEIEVTDTGMKVDLMKTLEELKMKIENKAEKIEGTAEEVKEKIEKGGK